MYTETKPGRAAYPDFVSVKEAAIMLGLHSRTIRRAIADGELRAVRLRGSLLIPIEALRQLPDVEPEED